MIVDVPAHDAFGAANRLDEVEIFWHAGSAVRSMKVFSEIGLGPSRLDYALPAEATAAAGTFHLRARGRRRIGGAGDDPPNADYLFYTALQRSRSIELRRVQQQRGEDQRRAHDLRCLLEQREHCVAGHLGRPPGFDRRAEVDHRPFEEQRRREGHATHEAEHEAGPVLFQSRIERVREKAQHAHDDGSEEHRPDEGVLRRITAEQPVSQTFPRRVPHHLAASVRERSRSRPWTAPRA